MYQKSLSVLFFAVCSSFYGADAQSPAPGELRISELLFDPQPGGKDFIELYNASARTLELRGLVLYNTAKEGYSTRESSIKVSCLLPPGQWIALTPDTADLRRRYPLARAGNLFPNALPTLDPDAGNLTLLYAGIRLDTFDYQSDMHHPLLKNRRGVSLERLSLERPAADRQNWHSAAGDRGYATPGARNSQGDQGRGKTPFFKLPEVLFSPDGDGYQEAMALQYETDAPGYAATILIFDAQGRTVRRLVHRDLLGAQGSYTWDGLDAEGRLVPVGLYVIWIEYVHPEKQVAPQTLTCVRAKKL